MKEFDVIRQCLAPLAPTPGAYALRDDVAQLPNQTAAAIITTDTLVEGVHFLPGDPLDLVGQKLVRVNLSDCLSKGARPTAALFNLTWPKLRTDAELKQLISGLTEFMPHEFPLIGGDTTSIDGPIVLSLTLIGECHGEGPVRRGGGKPGDDIWVSGTIGDAYLGLKCRQGALPSDEFLEPAYLRPNLPDWSISQCVSRFAHASADISDGLIADLEHICEASGLGAELKAEDIPLSDAAKKILGSSAHAIELGHLMGGGDDYQTLFTAPPENRADILDFVKHEGLALTRIGLLKAGAGVTALEANGNPMKILMTGWKHGDDR